MKQNRTIKKSALAAAMICATVSVSAQAAEVNLTNNQSAIAAFGLGTQSRAAAEALEREKTEDDLKLSPGLFSLKAYVNAEKAARQGSVSRRTRTADIPSALNVDILIKGSMESAREELGAVGFTVDATYGNSVGGTISPDNLEALSHIAAVQRINLAESQTAAGAVENQADFVQYSKKVKESLKHAPTGKGVTVGIISDSFDCIGVRNKPGTVSAATDVNNGELPADVHVVKERGDCLNGGIDEGRAMAQLVHDIAPDAKIAFYKPQSMTDYAQGIQTLALPRGQYDASGREGGGANIIVDDLYYFAEPFYEVGIVGDSITNVVKKGVAYFTLAGNFNQIDTITKADTSAYSTTTAQFVPYTPSQTGPTQVTGAQVLNVGAPGNSTVLPVTPAYTQNMQRIGIWWNQSYTAGNKSKIMACLTNADGTAINSKSWCQTQPLNQNPSLILNFTLPTMTPGSKYGLQIFSLEGVKPTSFTVMGFGDVAIDPAMSSQHGSIFGHSNTPAAFTLGAADFATTPECSRLWSEPRMESFSSRGNSPLLFDGQGNAIHIVPNKPDATAADGVSTSFFGNVDPVGTQRVFKDPACNLTSPYRFYGTSAAAPNAAAVAALILQDNPGIAPEEVYKVLRQTATPIGRAPSDGNYNYVSGYGFINAEKAINTLRAAQK